MIRLLQKLQGEIDALEFASGDAAAQPGAAADALPARDRAIETGRHAGAGARRHAAAWRIDRAIVARNQQGLGCHGRIARSRARPGPGSSHGVRADWRGRVLPADIVCKRRQPDAGARDYARARDCRARGNRRRPSSNPAAARHGGHAARGGRRRRGSGARPRGHQARTGHHSARHAAGVGEARVRRTDRGVCRRIVARDGRRVRRGAGLVHWRGRAGACTRLRQPQRHAAVRFAADGARVAGSRGGRAVAVRRGPPAAQRRGAERRRSRVSMPIAC